jgi:hypothetical protein
MNNPQSYGSNELNNNVSPSLKETHPIAKCYNFCPAILAIIEQANAEPSGQPPIISNSPFTLNPLPVSESIDDLQILNTPADQNIGPQPPQPTYKRQFCTAIEAIFAQAKVQFPEQTTPLQETELNLSYFNNLEKIVESPKIVPTSPSDEIKETELIISPVDIQLIQNTFTESENLSNKRIEKTAKTIYKKVNNANNNDTQFKYQVMNFINQDIENNYVFKKKSKFNSVQKRKKYNKIRYFTSKFNINLSLIEKNRFGELMRNNLRIFSGLKDKPDLKIVDIWLERGLEPDWNRFLKATYPELLKHFPPKQFNIADKDFFIDDNLHENVTPAKCYFYTVVTQLQMLPFCKNDEDILNYSLSKLQIVNSDQKEKVTKAINELLKNGNLFPDDYQKECLFTANFNFKNNISIDWSKFYYCLGVKL